MLPDLTDRKPAPAATVPGLAHGPTFRHTLCPQPHPVRNALLALGKLLLAPQDRRKRPLLREATLDFPTGARHTTRSSVNVTAPFDPLATRELCDPGERLDLCPPAASWD